MSKVKSNLLTGKQMQSILFAGKQNLEIKDQELVEFTKGF